MNSQLQNAANIASIIYSAIGLISVSIAAISTILLYHTYKSNYQFNKHVKDKEKVQKSCELAKYYADQILPQASFILKVFKYEKLDDFFKKLFDINSMHSFDTKELDGFLKSTDHSLISARIKAIKPESILAAQKECLRTEFEMLKLYEQVISAQAAAAKAEDTQRRQIGNIFLIKDLTNKICEFLNDLEWFSMNFVCNLADDSIVYDSLHQTFLSNVAVLYYFISSLNINSCNKYYTNIIELFKKWKKMLDEDTETENAVNDGVDEWKEREMEKHFHVKKKLE